MIDVLELARKRTSPSRPWVWKVISELVSGAFIQHALHDTSCYEHRMVAGSHLAWIAVELDILLVLVATYPSSLVVEGGTASLCYNSFHPSGGLVLLSHLLLYIFLCADTRYRVEAEL